MLNNIFYLIENNLEALITEVDGTSNFVGDKSSVILNYWFSKNIKAIIKTH